MWTLLICLGLAQVPASESTPSAPETWATLATELGAVAGESTERRSRSAPEPSTLRYRVHGVSDEPFDVELVPEGEGMRAVVHTRPEQTATLARFDGGWQVTDGDPALFAALLAAPVPARSTVWTAGETTWIEHIQPVDPEPMVLAQKCSCAVSVDTEHQSTDVVVASDGWPILAVVVDEERTTVLPGGPQHWGSSRATWHRTVWVRQDGPIPREWTPGPSTGSWSNTSGPGLKR